MAADNSKDAKQDSSEKKVDFVKVENIGDYLVNGIPFAQHSADLEESFNNGDKKLILVGGQGKYQSEFHELIETKEKEMQLIPMSKLYGKKNANLGHPIESPHGYYATDIMSFCITNSDNQLKYIIVIGINYELKSMYNVYDFQNDKWLFGENHRMPELFVGINDGFGHRSMLLNNSIIIISIRNDLHFYNVCDVLNPQLIKAHNIKASAAEWQFFSMMHCMELVESNKKYYKKEGSKVKQVHSFSIVIFGGSRWKESDPYSSKARFLKVNVTIVNGLTIEESITENVIQLIEKKINNNNNNNDSDKSQEQKRVGTKAPPKMIALQRCGYFRVVNQFGQSILVTIGGEKMAKTMNIINVSNTDSKPIALRKFLPFKVSQTPAVTLRNDKCHVLTDKHYFAFNLKDVIDNYDGYGFPCPIRWRIERIIWIGYEKNSKNETCLLATLSKDVIKLIISFLKYQVILE